MRSTPSFQRSASKVWRSAVAMGTDCGTCRRFRAGGASEAHRTWRGIEFSPLLVEEALMVEPTETETKESLDAFADAIERILAEAEEDPEIARQAPYSTPVRRSGV